MNSSSHIVKNICPDDKITEKFMLKAIDFDNEAGLNITFKV